MPNQANRSKDKSGIVQKKKNPTMPSTEKQGKKGSGSKHSNGGNGQNGELGSSANREDKTASGKNE